MKISVQHTVCWLMIWVCFFTWCTMPWNQAVAKETTLYSEKTREQEILDRLDLMFDGLRHNLAQPGANPFDVMQRAAELEYDIKRIFAFVRDEIVTVPYMGKLRGSRGVLISGGGNALEKSLLLRDLLTAGGTETRLMRATLSQAEGKSIIQNFLLQDSSSKVIDFGRMSTDLTNEEQALLADVAQQVGIQLEPAVAYLKGQIHEAQSIFSENWTLAELHAAQLHEVLVEAGIRPAMSFKTLHSKLIKAVQTHYWIEYRVPRTEKWVALDPSLPGMELGQAPAGSAKTIETIPEEMCGQVKITLELDKAVGQETTTTEILSVRLATTDTLFHPITLSINPAEEILEWQDLTKKNPESLFNVFSSFEQFQAVLAVGDENFASKPFDLQGKVYQVSKTGHVQELGSAASNWPSLFGGRNEQEKGTLQALRMLIEIYRPGQMKLVQERVLYEPISEDTAKQPSPIIMADILIQPNWADPGYWAFMQARSFLGNEALIRSILLQETPKSMRAVRFCPILAALAGLRQQALGRLLTESDGLGILWDSPFIAMNFQHVFLDESAHRVWRRTIVDIVNDPGVIVPGDVKVQETAWQSNLYLGIFNSAVEGAVLNDAMLVGKTKYGMGYFETARLRGRPLVVIGPGQWAEEEFGSFAERTQTWIRNYVPTGHALVFVETPGEPVDYWWSVNTTTGTCVARNPSGLGQAATQYTIIAAIVSGALCISPLIFSGSSVKGADAILCVMAAGFGGFGGWVASSKVGLGGAIIFLAMSLIFALVGQGVHAAQQEES